VKSFGLCVKFYFVFYESFFFNDYYFKQIEEYPVLFQHYSSDCPLENSYCQVRAGQKSVVSYHWLDEQICEILSIDKYHSQAVKDPLILRHF
jgi:hypothetical protein